MDACPFHKMPAHICPRRSRLPLPPNVLCSSPQPPLLLGFRERYKSPLFRSLAWKMSRATVLRYLGTILALSLHTTAIPLGTRADPNESTSPENSVSAEPSSSVQEESVGHLNDSWVVAVTVSLVVVVLALVGAVLFVKLRQRRKRSRRGRRNYVRASSQLVMAPERSYDHVWRGPYASRASNTRSPSPPSPAHLSEKDKRGPPKW
ncbi:hypothetical protein BD311DRAFT_744208 [Dichomitus squalens]|uniref:Transmembrane protein n=1 Tax=Dichomitus squalens TaxID=114155 RepID=A0A4Q9N851_9APHY|nr:hypothetical protein BD311DRAFT_744208 [Dichomitus squalens]